MTPANGRCIAVGSVEAPLEPYRSIQHDRAGRPRDAVAQSGVAVTQVCLSRDNIILIARLSAATRLSEGSSVTRVAILRLLLQEILEAGIEPRTVVTTGALIAGLRAHFERLRGMPAHRLTELAVNLGRVMPPTSTCLAVWAADASSVRDAGGPMTVSEPTTLRLPTAEIVALDNYRCDIRQASGLCISRSAILRAAIDSFACAFQV